MAVNELLASDAVRLFVARVRSHLPDFAVDGQNARVVAEICSRLDGLPLALELVAARVEGLGLSEVAVRLNDRFRLAVGRSHTAPTRQRTTSLLDGDERVLLRRLGVFVGSWTLAAAEAICAGDELAQTAVADVLERLVTKSLVVAEQVELGVRSASRNGCRATTSPWSRTRCTGSQASRTWTRSSFMFCGTLKLPWLRSRLAASTG